MAEFLFLVKPFKIKMQISIMLKHKYECCSYSCYYQNKNKTAYISGAVLSVKCWFSDRTQLLKGLFT